MFFELHISIQTEKSHSSRAQDNTTYILIYVYDIITINYQIPACNSVITILSLQIKRKK